MIAGALSSSELNISRSIGGGGDGESICRQLFLPEVFGHSQGTRLAIAHLICASLIIIITVVVETAGVSYANGEIFAELLYARSRFNNRRTVE